MQRENGVNVFRKPKLTLELFEDKSEWSGEYVASFEIWCHESETWIAVEVAWSKFYVPLDGFKASTTFNVGGTECAFVTAAPRRDKSYKDAYEKSREKARVSVERQLRRFLKSLSGMSALRRAPIQWKRVRF